MAEVNMRIGAYGWCQPHWTPSFYPEDLPEDWRLSYYSNEFDTVMVPADYWLEGKGYDCADWIDEVSEQFRFYIECPLVVVTNQDEFSLFMQQLSLLQPQLSGVVVADDLVGFEEGNALQQIAKSTSVFSNTGCTDKVESIWTQANQAEKLTLAMFQDDLKDMRKTRSHVEQFVGGEKRPRQDIIVSHQALAAGDLMQLCKVVEITGLQN